MQVRRCVTVKEQTRCEAPARRRGGSAESRCSAEEEEDAESCAAQRLS
jgi:hypothetical protein